MSDERDSVGKASAARALRGPDPLSPEDLTAPSDRTVPIAREVAPSDHDGTKAKKRGKMTLRIPDDEIARPVSEAPKGFSQPPIVAQRIISIGSERPAPASTQQPDPDATLRMDRPLTALVDPDRVLATVADVTKDVPADSESHLGTSDEHNAASNGSITRILAAEPQALPPVPGARQPSVPPPPEVRPRRPSFPGVAPVASSTAEAPAPYREETPSLLSESEREPPRSVSTVDSVEVQIDSVDEVVFAPSDVSTEVQEVEVTDIPVEVGPSERNLAVHDAEPITERQSQRPFVAAPPAPPSVPTAQGSSPQLAQPVLAPQVTAPTALPPQAAVVPPAPPTVPRGGVGHRPSSPPMVAAKPLSATQPLVPPPVPATAVQGTPQAFFPPGVPPAQAPAPAPPQHIAPAAPAAPAAVSPQRAPAASVPDGAEAAPKKKRAWWEDLFNEDYLRATPPLSTRTVLREADFIEDSLGLVKGARILDLACGTGHHALELARRGYAVVGVDSSSVMLTRATEEAKRAGIQVPFTLGDMRELGIDEKFDGVYCWDTSFGYFDEERNGQVIAGVWKALRKGGQFLLDVANRDYIIKQVPSVAWFEGEGCVCMDEVHVDNITSRMRVKRTMIFEDSRSREIEYSIRLYSIHELGRMLHEHGFRVAEISGRVATPGVFFGSDSPRALILAEKR